MQNYATTLPSLPSLSFLMVIWVLSRRLSAWPVTSSLGGCPRLTVNPQRAHNLVVNKRALCVPRWHNDVRNAFQAGEMFLVASFSNWKLVFNLWKLIFCGIERPLDTLTPNEKKIDLNFFVKFLRYYRCLFICFKLHLRIRKYYINCIRRDVPCIVFQWLKIIT